MTCPCGDAPAVSIDSVLCTISLEPVAQSAKDGDDTLRYWISEADVGRAGNASVLLEATLKAKAAKPAKAAKTAPQVGGASAGVAVMAPVAGPVRVAGPDRGPGKRQVQVLAPLDQRRR